MDKVLILGRPNVGKSSLFNRLIRNRRALVLNQAGVTRDIIKGQTTWWGHSFEVWDSGGLTWDSSAPFSSPIQKRVREAIEKSDLIIFVMDAHLGLHEDDKMIFKWIQNKKYLLVANKVDHHTDFDSQLSEFYTLGHSFIKAAFEKDENIDQVVSWIIENQSATESQPQIPIESSLLFTGQTNVGKSSLCNLLLKANRMITSEKAHSTTDIVDEVFQFSGKNYKILDTAGIRKRSRRTEDLEKISSSKTLSYFNRAQIILLVIDGTRKVARQDIRLFSYCMENFKPAILIVNKWDLVKDLSKEEFRFQVQQEFKFFPQLPIVFMSAQSGMGVGNLMKTVDQCMVKAHTRISTSTLNQFFKQAVQETPLPVYGTKNIKFYYVTQLKKQYPSFIIFTNEPKGVPLSYKKFLVKKIQDRFSLQGIPIQTTFVPR